MLNILKSKIIIYFAIFGAAFSFLLAIFSGVSVFWIIIRIFAGGILMGSLGFGLDFFLRQALSDDDYKALFNKPQSENGEGDRGAKNIDVIDDAGLSPEKEYQEIYSQDKNAKNAELHSLTGVPDENMYAETSSPTTDESDHSAGPTMTTSGQEFREQDLSAAPRVSPKPFEESDAGLGTNSMALNEPARNDSDGIPFRPPQSSASSSDGTVKFNVGKKKITADPKVIAKAIKTVLQRDK